MYSSDTVNREKDLNFIFSSFCFLSLLVLDCVISFHGIDQKKEYFNFHEV